MQYPYGVFHSQNCYSPKSWPRLSVFRTTLVAGSQNQLNPSAWKASLCFKLVSSINLLDSWPTTSTTTWHTTTWHTTTWHVTAPTCCLVYLHHNRVDNAFDLFLLRLELILLGQLILIEPIQRFLHCRFDLLLVPRLEL